MKKLFLTAILMMMAILAFADEVVIGTGTITSYSPFDVGSGYARSASLYTSAEITQFGVIQQLAWNVETARPTTLCPIKIYLKQTTATSLTSANWSTMTTGATLVYSGNYVFNHTGWMLIDITDFNYTANNLMVLCEANYGGTGTQDYVRFMLSSATSMHATAYSDNAPPTSTLSISSSRPNIAVIFPPITAPVANELLSPTNTATEVLETATLSWKASFRATGYKLYFGTNYPPTNIANGTNLGNVLSYDPTGYLLFSQTYYWQVVPTNSTGSATGCPVWSFTTRANATVNTFPKVWDFDTPTSAFPPTNWTNHKGVLGSPALLDINGTGSWTQDDWGNFGNPAKKCAKLDIYQTRNGWLISPPIAVPSSNYELKFDVAYMTYNTTNPPQTSGTDDKFIILMGDGSSWTPANVVRQWDNAGSPYVLNSILPGGMTVTIPLGTPGTKYIAFYAASTIPNSDNDLMIDNIEIRQMSVNFGDVALNRATEWTNVAVSNTTGSTLSISATNVSMVGPQANQFAFSTINLPISLASGQSVNIPVRMTATSEGQKSATLRVVCNSANFDVLLNGAGLPENTVPIGNGSTYMQLPINTFYGYSYSQSLFLQSEINVAGKRIEKVRYYWGGSEAATASNDWVIYMGHTTKTFFATTADWIPLTSLTQVFSGVVNIPGTPGWIEITLDSPFVYNNTDNLVIAVDENEPSYNFSGHAFACSSLAANRSIRYNGDSVNANPATPPTGILTQGIPNIRLQFGLASVLTITDASDLSFGSVFLGDSPVITRQLQSTGSTPVVITGASMYNASSAFSTGLSGFPINLAPGASLNVNITFHPLQARTYSDTLYVYNSSQNNPVIKIALLGVGVYSPPQPPQGVSIMVDGNDTVIQWEAVTHNTSNAPVTVPYYFIYGAVIPDPDPTQQVFLGYATGTTFRHMGVGLPGTNVQSPRVFFYTITAVVWYPPRSGKNPLDRLIGLSREEVSREIELY